MNNTGWKTIRRGAFFLCTVLFLFTGCKDLFHKDDRTTPSYTITFDAQGGSVSQSNISVNAGGHVTSLPTPTRSGYTFDGWFTQTNGGGSQFTPDTAVNENIIVYAKWVTVTYTVSFDAQDGSVSPSSVSVNAGGHVTSLPTPTRSGYTFDGWFTQTNGGGSQFIPDTAVNENITVYAKWTPGVSIRIQLLSTSDLSPLSNISLFENDEEQFSTESGYVSYQWYWDGEAIADAYSKDYTLAANSRTPGIYELSVFVTDGAGEMLSARCLVIIKAN